MPQFLISKGTELMAELRAAPGTGTTFVDYSLGFHIIRDKLFRRVCIMKPTIQKRIYVTDITTFIYLSYHIITFLYRVIGEVPVSTYDQGAKER